MLSSPSNPSPPTVGNHLLISFPEEHILLLQLHRPKQLNCMTEELEEDLRRTLRWFEATPTLWVLILAGSPDSRAFCAGQDLKEWLIKRGPPSPPPSSSSSSSSSTTPPLEPSAQTRSTQHRIRHLGGFGGLSTWDSSKPLILAVDGLAMGGGMEVLLNMDLVLATSRAKFALPEVLRGVVAAQGGIPRLLRLVGHIKASELLLTGRTFSAEEMRQMGLINNVVPVEARASTQEGQALVLAEALRYARMITSASPDSVRVTKQALRLARDGSAAHVDQSTLQSVAGKESRGLYAGENFREGLTSFKEKRQPRWKDPIDFQRTKSKL